MSTTPTAWLYPGHGSQHPGMGREALRTSAAREILDQAEALSGEPVREVMLRGPEERLCRPVLLEPALTALSLAHTALLEERGEQPAAVAGYSAGEVAALYAAGVVSRTDALRLAVLRGQILEDAADEGRVRMVALYGLPAAAVEEIVGELAGAGSIWIAGWNAPDHTTVVGEAPVVQEAERWARRRGAAASVIPVVGAWHSPLVERAANRAWEVSHAVKFRAPRVPLLLGASGRAEQDPERIRRLVARQIAEPVRWRQMVDAMVHQGCTGFLELGPGGVLSTLVRRQLRDRRDVRVCCAERRGSLLLGAAAGGVRRTEKRAAVLATVGEIAPTPIPTP